MTQSYSKLFQPVKVGALDLQHRVVMAPLTRVRASAEAVPSEWAEEYYTQRASEGGLIVSEGTFIAQEAGGMNHAPGIYTSEQIEAWKPITAAVHAKGGYIFCQLWALGRVADPKEVKTVFGASTIPCKGSTENVTAMTPEDIERFVGHYRQAAINSREAGFDGVEIHGANGYILDQFLQTNSNNRTDSYGGSLENRFRFPLAVLNACSDAIGASRVGIRMSPFSEFQDMKMPTPLDTFTPWAKAIVAAQPELAYVHAVEGRIKGSDDVHGDQKGKQESLQEIRDAVKEKNVPFIAAGGFKPENAIEHADNTGDLVCFGRYFISNPDLPERIRNHWPLVEYDRSTFYIQEKRGYIDYPTYQQQQKEKASL